jgi:hypothetical protein
MHERIGTPESLVEEQLFLEKDAKQTLNQKQPENETRQGQDEETHRMVPLGRGAFRPRSLLSH